jgi:hypothetical protein
LPLSSRGANWTLMREFVADLEKLGVKKTVTSKGNLMYLSVAHRHIAKLLMEFKGADSDIRFQPQQLAALIADATDQKLMSWDVVIPNGSGVEVSISGSRVRLQKRRVDERNQSLIVSGSKRRVGSRGIEAEGVPEADVKRVIAEAAGKQVSDHDYRAIRPRPLLLLHLLDAQRVTARDDQGKATAMERVFPTGAPLTAVGLSFPKFADGATEKRVKYTANLVKLRELFETEVDDEELATDETM